jgi:ketosteroid isomerase-like protein
MKMYIFITIFLSFFFVLTKPVLAQITLQEQGTAKKEISETVNVIFQSLENMDVEALFKSYSNYYDFILFTTDASMADYQEAKNHNAEWFKSLSLLKVTTIKEEFRFLPGNIVVCAWEGKFEMTLKTGVHLRIDKFGVTFIFSKIDKHWKVIYQHSSSVPPVKDNL